MTAQVSDRALRCFSAHEQRQAAEDAVRLIATGKYLTAKSIGGSRASREATSRPDPKERQ